MASESAPKNKVIHNLRNGSFTVATWADGHESVQFRISKEMWDAHLGILTGNKPEYIPDGAEGFSNYGSFDIFRSDFFPMIPAFVALANLNGYDVTISKKS